MEVSRRNFNFGFLGALVALFLPRKEAAGGVDTEPYLRPVAYASKSGNYSTSGDSVRLFGEVVSKPHLQHYVRGDGSPGWKVSFRMVVDGRDFSMVSWQERALWCHANLRVGDSVVLLGSRTGTSGIEMIRASRPGARF